MNNSTPALARRLNTVDEAAEILRCHRATLYRLIKNGGIDTVRVGSRLLISEGAIDRYINAQESRPVVDQESRDALEDRGLSDHQVDVIGTDTE